jgi:hypothetical protein
MKAASTEAAFLIPFRLQRSGTEYQKISYHSEQNAME